MKKWNYDTNKYDDYTIPEDWHVNTVGFYMDEIVNCANCGVKTIYGYTYTSKEIKDDLGFGYSVCGECHAKEWERIENAEKREKN